ncbi:hypothetical protein [Clostridium sporogenes]|nr:hypothetical protein [Clostridium sporogenes]EHN15419.1 hypothetical protein IYC_08633 [Clostridium sporogenes PA 3679]MDU4599521.1 hypothetical protein [Clostridium sporogenes]
MIKKLDVERENEVSLLKKKIKMLERENTKLLRVLLEVKSLLQQSG